MHFLHADGSTNWGELIETLRALRGMSHEDLAQQARCTAADIADWERGIGEPDADAAAALWHLAPKPALDPSGPDNMDARQGHRLFDEPLSD